MKELTCGSFGYLLWYRWCFSISLTNQELIIKYPFRKISIPLSQIEKMISEKVKWGPKALRIFHHYPQAHQKIYFISTDWNAWFTEFEKKGIQTEDKENLRHASATTIKWAKKINLFFGVLGILAAIVGLIAAVVAFLKTKGLI